jgi:methylase of polypeptide subunit release factors
MITTDILDFEFHYFKEFDICGPDIAAKFCTFLQENYPTNRYHKALEYCSGNGAIGFKLLRQGLVEDLTLSDVNRQLEETINKTSQSNDWQEVSRFIESELLTDIPQQQFDLFVCNPPWRSFMLPGPITEIDKLKHFDFDWKLHRQMYDSIDSYIGYKSDVFMIEDHRHSTPEFWNTFIKHKNLSIKQVYDFEFETTRKNGESHLLDTCYIMHIKKT